MARYTIQFDAPRRAGIHEAASIADVRAIVRDIAARNHGRRTVARVKQDGFAFGVISSAAGGPPRLTRV